MKMNIPGQDEIDDPVIFDRMRADRQADLDFVFKSTNPDYPNRRTASMGLDELRAAVVQANGGVVPDSESSRPLTAAQSSFLETGRQEKLARDALARAATSETMKSVEEHGYLYHYAPKDARESILKEGMRPSQARTAIGDIKGPMAHYATHVPENSLYFFTDPNFAPSAEMLFDGGRPDMYRIKIEPGMLDNMAVDPRLPIVGGRGSAVILPIKGDSILAELFAVDVEFDYGAESGTIKGRTFLSDSQRARVQPVVKAATHGQAVDPRSVAPVQKAKPQAILPVTQQGKPLMNIPGHGQVIDPIEIATRRAQRQADLDEAFNPIQINQRVNAQRKAALPLKKANKAQRRAAKNARALELQKQREEGSKLARAEAERIKAERAAQQVTQPTTVSLSGAAKDRSTLGVTGEVRSKPIYVNPVTGKREGRPQFVGNRKGKLKVGQTREGSMDAIRVAGFEISIDGAPSRSLLYNPTIDAPTYEAYGSISDGSRKKTGMSHGEAVDYISKRVRNDGGTVGNTKSLYGFDQQVKKLIDDGIVSRGDVIDILKGKNQANEFGRILPRSSGAGIVSPPGQLTGMGNVLDLSKNAQQLISGLGLEDDMRLSYGEALLESSRMDQQGGILSTGKQIQLGGRLNLADKQAMMVDDDKIQTAARLAREEERLAPIRAERVQAVINRGSSELGETIIHPRLAPAAEQAEEVVRKAPISRRTMEKMMSSNMLAAGVAAGGLGLLYASNKIRGEREVGR